MASRRPLMFSCVMATVCSMVSALRAKRTNDFEIRVAAYSSYTFDTFIEEFDRTYTMGSAEYFHRSAVFAASLAQIFATNARKDQSWTAGMHPFMDLTDDERQQLHGYKPPGRRKSGTIALEMNTTLSVYGGSGDSFEAVTPPVLNQGSLCGSCWAISAVAAVEAQLMKTDNPTRQHLYGSPLRLSTQAVLECAQIENPHNCGGPGGCKGATSEVAFDYMRDHGIPLAYDHPYHPNPSHLSKTCPLEPYPANWARVTIDGWKILPSNKAQSLMQAIVEDGAVVVAIDSHNLYPYSSGIFDDCPKDAVVSHALLAKGYGESGGQKYWSLQNSWGLQWGEAGSVRVLRRDNEDQWCGTDHHPEEGFACDGDTTPVTVCGTCGILFDMVIPSSPHVEAAQQTNSDPSSPATQPDSGPPGPVAGASIADQMRAMVPPSVADVVSADVEVDGYLSTPALHTSVNSNQVHTTPPPLADMPSELPDASLAGADQQLAKQNGAIAQSSDVFMPAPQAAILPSTFSTEESFSVGEPTPQAVVIPSSAPTSDVAKMQQLMAQHELVTEAIDAPPAEEQVKADDVPPAVQVLSAKAEQPAVDAQVVQSDFTSEQFWDRLPEAKPAADASREEPVAAGEASQTWANSPTVEQQASLDLKMPVPTTFSDSLNQFNPDSKSFDSINAAVDVGSGTPVPAAEVPLPENPRPEPKHLEDASLDVHSSFAAARDLGPKVSVLDSIDVDTTSSPPDSSATDGLAGMKRLFSQDKLA